MVEKLKWLKHHIYMHIYVREGNDYYMHSNRCHIDTLFGDHLQIPKLSGTHRQLSVPKKDFLTSSNSRHNNRYIDVHSPITTSAKETFLQDFLEILNRTLQNF